MEDSGERGKAEDVHISCGHSVIYIEAVIYVCVSPPTRFSHDSKSTNYTKKKKTAAMFDRLLYCF